MFSDSIKEYLTQTNHQSLNPKAIFFDMDGVLYDSMDNHAKAWVESMKDVGFTFSEYDCYMNEGRTGHSTIDLQVKKEFGRNADEEEKERIYKLKSSYFDSFGGAEPMPFANDLLQKIKQEGKQIFVVTGSGQPSLLDNLSKDFPTIFNKENMVTAFDVKHGKPNPEPYLMALEKSGVKVNEAVVVENAPLGAKSGSSAGLFTIAVNTGPLEDRILKEYGANIVLSSIKELFEKWDEFIADALKTKI